MKNNRVAQLQDLLEKKIADIDSSLPQKIKTILLSSINFEGLDKIEVTTVGRVIKIRQTNPLVKRFLQLHQLDLLTTVNKELQTELPPGFKFESIN